MKKTKKIMKILEFEIALKWPEPMKSTRVSAFRRVLTKPLKFIQKTMIFENNSKKTCILDCKTYEF